jgi:hypothetical protein
MTVLADGMVVTISGSSVFLPNGFPSNALEWGGKAPPARIPSPPR